MTETAATEEVTLIAPGKVLRDAREAKGLTQSEVAGRMRLSMQKIKDIEADDYSHFSAPIYVRGYLRNYAAILDLAHDKLIEAFEKMGFLEQLNQARQTNYIVSSVSKTVRLQRSKRQIARWISWLVVAVLVALVATWWYGQRNHKHALVNPSLLTRNNIPTHKAMNLPIKRVFRK